LLIFNALKLPEKSTFELIIYIDGMEGDDLCGRAAGV
jgi:hypothetical protein